MICNAPGEELNQTPPHPYNEDLQEIYTGLSQIDELIYAYDRVFERQAKADMSRVEERITTAMGNLPEQIRAKLPLLQEAVRDGKDLSVVWHRYMREFKESFPQFVGKKI